MSLLKLPKEILSDIWSFIVDVRDIIRYKNTNIITTTFARHQGIRHNFFNLLNNLVLELINLTDLDLRDSLVTKNTTKQLWKLTNLEIMDISGLEIGDRVDWRVFKKLPKLSTLIHERYPVHNSAIPYEEHQYEVMNSLTQLTLLGIRTGFGNPFPLEKISNLTNLRALSVAVNSSYEDFAKFQHLTYLNVTLGTKVERIRFPKGLKIMAIDTFPHTDAIFKEIGDLDSLTELSLYYPDTKKLHHISRLTNLEWLTFGKEELSPEFFRHLTVLANLRGLSLSYPPKSNINQLQQLTQLYKLDIDSASTEEMTKFRKKLPFTVYCNTTYRHYNYKKDSMLMFIPYLFALGLWYILHPYVIPTLNAYIFSEGRIDLVRYIREFLYYLKNIFT